MSFLPFLFPTFLFQMSLATIPPPSAIIDTNWDILLSDPMVVVPVTCTLVAAAGILSLIIFLAHRNCTQEILSSNSSSPNDSRFQLPSTESCKLHTFFTTNQSFTNIQLNIISIDLTLLILPLFLFFHSFNQIQPNRRGNVRI